MAVTNTTSEKLLENVVEVCGDISQEPLNNTFHSRYDAHYVKRLRGSRAVMILTDLVAVAGEYAQTGDKTAEESTNATIANFLEAIKIYRTGIYRRLAKTFGDKVPAAVYELSLTG